jgi:LysM repeat protein
LPSADFFEKDFTVMRALPFLASLLLAAPVVANAAPQADLLQSRCAEQERQIRQLEEENSRLKSLLSSAGKTAPVEAPKNEEKSPRSTEDSKPSNGPVKVSVRNGDTWVKLAKRNSTTPEALAKLNKMKTTTDLRAGQEILVPSSRDSDVAETPVKEKESGGGTHIVKEGETFYSIAKRYGLGPEALQDANPGVKANALREGMTLRIGAKTVVAKNQLPASKTSDDKKMLAAKPPLKKPADKADAPSSKSTTPDNPPKHQELSAKEPAPESEPAPASHSPGEFVSNKPRVHTINIDDEISFGGFAQAHGTTPEKLNALNGLNLNSSTVLAKGSELRVPAQP